VLAHSTQHSALCVLCFASNEVHGDVPVQVTRRAWGGHPGAQATIKRAMTQDIGLRVTQCQNASEELLSTLVPDVPAAGAGGGAGAGAAGSE